MKRKLITATMAAMMMVSSAVPAMAMVGAKQPESPDMMVITSVRQNKMAPMPEKQIMPVAEPVLIEERIQPKKEVKVNQDDQKWQTMKPVLYHGTSDQKPYEIQTGDTLWKIAQKVMKTDQTQQIRKGVELIRAANQLENPDLIFAGDRLNLPDQLSS